MPRKSSGWCKWILFIVVLGVAGLALCSLLGCDLFEPKTVSPFSEKQVTAGELQREADKYVSDTQKAEAQDRADAAAKIAKAKRDATLEARKLTNASDTQLADIETKLAEATDSAVSEFAANQTQRDAFASNIEARVNSANEDLARKRAATAGILNLTKPFAAMVPGGAQGFDALNLLFGGGAVAATVYGRSKAKQAGDTGTKLATLDDAASRVIDSIDVLKNSSPAVAQAFKDHARDLVEWQGASGMALVSRHQAGVKLGGAA